MMRSLSFLKVITVLVGVVMVFSCSNDGDRRGDVKKDLGEPDEIIKSEYAGMKAELYVYARKDINRTYEFRKTTAGCGGEGDWYIYRTYYTNYIFPDMVLYLPPTIVHTPIETAPSGQKINISAKVTDDEEVVTVSLFYRVTGQDEFFETRMFYDDQDVYSAIIPAEAVTSKGVEYYIEAWDSGHSSDLPTKNYYTVAVSSSAKTVVTGLAETTEREFTPAMLSRPADTMNEAAPVGP